MSSYHYSTPAPPPTNTLADMILFYAHREMRAELMIDHALWDDLMDEARNLIAVWTPATPWERSIVSQGRHLQWLIWQVANSRCDPMISMYTDLDDVVAPWVIEIDTLPDYQQMQPMPQLRDDVD